MAKKKEWRVAPHKQGTVRVSKPVLDEAAELCKLFLTVDVMDMVTTHGKCRVHKAVEGDSKRCCQCQNDLTKDSFNRNSSSGDGLQAHCRQCDLYAVRKHAKSAKTKAKIVATKAMAEVKKEIKEELRGTKGKITRSVWPSNERQRLKALKECLQRALVEYDGQEAQISVALNIGVDEIRDAIAGSKELTKLLEHAKTIAISKVEANAYQMATGSNNAAMIKFWLTNNSDRWSEKSTVEMRNVGFGVPDEDTAPAPILKIVNQKPED